MGWGWAARCASARVPTRAQGARTGRREQAGPQKQSHCTVLSEYVPMHRFFSGAGYVPPLQTGTWAECVWDGWSCRCPRRTGRIHGTRSRYGGVPSNATGDGETIGARKRDRRGGPTRTTVGRAQKCQVGLRNGWCWYASTPILAR